MPSLLRSRCLGSLCNAPSPTNGLVVEGALRDEPKQRLRRPGGGGGGGYSPKFRIGVCRERSQALTLSKDKQNES